MPRSAPKVVLTSKQRERLTGAAVGPDGRIADRAQVALLAADGRDTATIMKMLRVSKPFVVKWRRCFARPGIDVSRELRPTRSGSRGQVDRLRNLVEEQHRDGKLVTVRWLAQQLQLPASTVQFWHEREGIPIGPLKPLSRPGRNGRLRASSWKSANARGRKWTHPAVRVPLTDEERNELRELARLQRRGNSARSLLALRARILLRVSLGFSNAEIERELRLRRGGAVAASWRRRFKKEGVACLRASRARVGRWRRVRASPPECNR